MGYRISIRTSDQNVLKAFPLQGSSLRHGGPHYYESRMVVLMAAAANRPH